MCVCTALAQCVYVCVYVQFWLRHPGRTRSKFASFFYENGRKR